MSERSLLGAHMEQELVSQPEMWRRAIAQQQPEDLLPAKGAKVAVVGFGASCFIADAYPAMGHRHAPISNAAPNRVTWILGTQPEGLDTDVTRTGAIYANEDRRPLADLASIHRVTLDRARACNLDPDSPRNLTRSVILEG